MATGTKQQVRKKNQINGLKAKQRERTNTKERVAAIYSLVQFH